MKRNEHGQVNGTIGIILVVLVVLIFLIVAGIVTVDASQQKYTVKHETGAFDAPISCPAIWEIKKIPPKGIRDCNLADGKLIVWNNTPGYVSATVDTSLSYPEYVSNGP